MLGEELLCQEFQQSKNDCSLFIRRNNSKVCIVAFYVDNVVLTRDDLSTVNNLKTRLDYQFGIKDLGELNYYLGIQVTHTTYEIILSRQKFVKEIIAEAG